MIQYAKLPTHPAAMSSSESPPPQKERLPHSCAGCLSFAIAIFAVTAVCIGYGIGFFADFIPENWGQRDDPDPLLSTAELIFVSAVYSSIIATLLAFVLAIDGLLHARTQKVYSIWGLVLSVLLLILFASVIISASSGGCC